MLNSLHLHQVRRVLPGSVSATQREREWERDGGWIQADQWGRLLKSWKACHRRAFCSLCMQSAARGECFFACRNFWTWGSRMLLGGNKPVHSQSSSQPLSSLYLHTWQKVILEHIQKNIWWTLINFSKGLRCDCCGPSICYYCYVFSWCGVFIKGGAYVTASIYLFVRYQNNWKSSISGNIDERSKQWFNFCSAFQRGLDRPNIKDQGASIIKHSTMLRNLVLLMYTLLLGLYLMLLSVSCFRIWQKISSFSGSAFRAPSKIWSVSSLMERTRLDG